MVFVKKKFCKKSVHFYGEENNFSKKKTFFKSSNLVCNLIIYLSDYMNNFKD